MLKKLFLILSLNVLFSQYLANEEKNIKSHQSTEKDVESYFEDKTRGEISMYAEYLYEQKVRELMNSPFMNEYLALEEELKSLHLKRIKILDDSDYSQHSSIVHYDQKQQLEQIDKKIQLISKRLEELEEMLNILTDMIIQESVEETIQCFI